MDRDESRARAGALLADWNEAPDGRESFIARLSPADAPALEMVGGLDDSSVGELLATVASSAASKEIRKAARRGIHRLRASGRDAPVIAPSSAGAMHLAPVEVRLAQVTASMPDGVGSRGLWLFAERSTGGGLLYGTVVNETVGMKGCFVGELTKRRLAERLAEVRKTTDLPWAELPPDYGRALLAEALALNESTGFPVPPDFQTWGSLLGELGTPPDRALIYEHVNGAQIRLEPHYLEECDKLMDEPELAAWLLEFHELRPFLEQLKQAQSSQIVLNDEARKEREERVMNAIIRQVFTDEFRRGFRRRLEEAAYVLLRDNRERQANWAVAAAIGLEQPLLSETVIARISQTPSRAQHPFVRALVERSVEIARELEAAGIADAIPRRTAYDPIE